MLNWWNFSPYHREAFYNNAISEKSVMKALIMKRDVYNTSVLISSALNPQASSDCEIFHTVALLELKKKNFTNTHIKFIFIYFLFYSLLTYLLHKYFVFIILTWINICCICPYTLFYLKTNYLQEIVMFANKKISIMNLKYYSSKAKLINQLNHLKYICKIIIFLIVCNMLVRVGTVFGLYWKVILFIYN